MINRNTIDKIFEAARIEEVVADFVQLKRAGSNLKGLSPWSDEKTPSFFVSPAKGIFKDFSSGKGGNAVTFLMELEHMSYPEALRYIADKYAIEVEETEMGPKEKEDQSLRESLVLVNKFALESFEKNLWENDEGKSIGLSYFRERGFSDKTIRKFALGYALEKNDALLKTAVDAGHKEEHLLNLGLTKEGNYGKYDFFRGRVIFPIRNVSGRCIAFAGRTLKADNKVKYINSPESELYDKSKTLYGLYEGKQSIIKEDKCFLVEGYTDVISLNQAGVEYAVASSGTSLTSEQAKLIKRYTKNVSVLYDGDKAGINAALRGIDLLLTEGLQVKVLLFPEGHDPDSFARSVSQTELEEYLNTGAKDFTDFMIEVLMDGHPDDPIKRAEATRRIVESLSLITDQITRSIYIQRCSKKLEIPEKALLNELNKFLRKRTFRKAGVDPETIPDEPQHKEDQEGVIPVSDSTIWEKEVTRILINYGAQEIEVDIQSDEGEDEKVKVQVAEYILHDLLQDEISFKSEVFGGIIERFRIHFKEVGSFPTTEKLVRNAELSEAIAAMISSPYELSENWADKHRIYTDSEEKDLRRTVFDPLMRLKLSKIKTLMREVEQAIKSAESEEELNLHLQEKIKLDQMKIQLSDFFGSTII
ncbi:DNA primase [Cryomorphaceae bacterium 1068]|nr:DNA primase [Cryomorphaceae bacterium 1068]